MSHIKLFHPGLPVDEVMSSVRTVIESNWLGNGPKVKEFEEKFAPYTGHKYFVATSSCTAALHLVLHSMDTGKDSVWSTPITFVSTNAVIRYEELYIRFCDVDQFTGLAKYDHSDDWGRFASYMVVHLAGQPCTLPQSNYIIEDCAHALGADLPPTDNPRCWSFAATKNLPIGEGGGVSTNDPYFAARLSRLRWMGITKSTADRALRNTYSWEYDIPVLGWKYDMSEVTAAIGLALLPHLDEWQSRRNVIAHAYQDGLKYNLGGRKVDVDRSANYFFPAFFENRDEVMNSLTASGIEYGMHYKPNTRYAPFCTEAKLPGVEWYADHELTLPMHPSLSDADVDRIVKVVNSCGA